MGIGDPYHKHPLTIVSNTCEDGGYVNCFHCELPITKTLSCYGCKGCNYYTHESCHDLPIILRHPIHDQHPLIRFEPTPTPRPSSSSISSLPASDLSSLCQNPCGRFAYHCPTCQLFFHLKYLFTLHHEKHNHLLVLSEELVLPTCNVCGFCIVGFHFGCRSCKFYIHHECSLVPVTIKRHHVHELTLRHNFPEECDQVYCDLCEDKDGEMDRALSYYYCVKCDYIAHVHCCITEPIEDAFLYKRLTHEHPLKITSNPRDWNGEIFLSCSQCNHEESPFFREYPSAIKHPRHPEHTLEIDGKGESFNCTECEFTINRKEALVFNHPLWRFSLEFGFKNTLFRCYACGELGEGCRVGDNMSKRFDLHLECFALPGKLEHESHPNHPLYLRWIGSNSTSEYRLSCDVCTKEMDPQLWLYFCQECNYAAHMDCIASHLLSTLRSSLKNDPNFCAIIEPNKTLFECQIADTRPPKRSYSSRLPMLKLQDDDDTDNYDLGRKLVDEGLQCPKCNLLISTENRYTTIKEWESSCDVISANSSAAEPLSFLDEQIIDELCCPICNLLIFPPTYSCASCHIFFHKSCAELPQKILYNETTYVLRAPPFPQGFSECNYCADPISSFAYLSLMGGKIFDVRCASKAPLLKLNYHTHHVSFGSVFSFERCLACKNSLGSVKIAITCEDCKFNLHPECGLLPTIIKHRIHWHPLELAINHAELYDEYVCDVCEKDLNPNLWAYRCVEECGIRATSHVSCVITSKKKCHFRYEDECQNMTEDQMLAFRKTEAGRRKYGSRA